MLSRKTSEDDVRRLFEPFGTVTEVFLMRNKDDEKSSKGSAFVKYSSRDEAQRAINTLNGIYRDQDAPSPLQVRFAAIPIKNAAKGGPMVPLATLAGLQNQLLSYAAQAQGLQGLQQQVPTQGAGGQWLWPGAGDPSLAGYGGLQSQQQDFSALGFQGMNPYAAIGPKPGGGGMGVPAAPSAAITKGPPGANLFIYNLPDSYTDPDLISLFSNFGQVVSANVQIDKATGRSKGYGFVSYSDLKSAQAAIAAMDGFVMGNKKLNVRIKKDSGSAASGATRPHAYAPY